MPVTFLGSCHGALQKLELRRVKMKVSENSEQLQSSRSAGSKGSQGTAGAAGRCKNG